MPYRNNTFAAVATAAVMSLSGTASAQTTLLTQHPDLNLGATTPVGGRLEIVELAVDTVFGPGRTGTIGLRFTNYGSLQTIGYDPTGCWGTMSVTLQPPDRLQVNITAPPATASTEVCGIALNATFLPTAAVPGPLGVEVDAGTLANLTFESATFANWTNASAWISPSIQPMPAGSAGGVADAVDLEVLEASVGSVYADAGNPIVLTLPAGFSWIDAGTGTTLGQYMSGGVPAIDPTDSRRLVINYLTSTQLPSYADLVLRLSGQRIRIPANAALGPVLIQTSLPIRGGGVVSASPGIQVATVVAAATNGGNVQGIPTLSEWGMIILSLLTVGAAWASLRGS